MSPRTISVLLCALKAGGLVAIAVLYFLTIAHKTRDDVPEVKRLEMKHSKSHDAVTKFTVTINSEDYFWGNSANISFDTRVVLKENGRLCLFITIPDSKRECRYPDIRARLSGAAMVDIFVREKPESGLRIVDRFAELEGCSFLPVHGRYFLDINLVHCSMNIGKDNVTSTEIKSMCPNTPVVRPVKNFSFAVESFVRTKENSSPVLFAWIWAPRCRIAQVSHDEHMPSSCTEQRPDGDHPHMFRTKFQVESFLSYYQLQSFDDQRLARRFEKYSFLPVDFETGIPIPGFERSITRHFSKTFSFLNTEDICFFGDSHTRFLAYRTTRILAGEAIDSTAEMSCMSPAKNWTSGYSSVKYIQMRFAEQGTSVVSQLAECRAIFISNGHWDAVSELRGHTQRHKTNE